MLDSMEAMLAERQMTLHKRKEPGTDRAGAVLVNRWLLSNSWPPSSEPLGRRRFR